MAELSRIILIALASVVLCAGAMLFAVKVTRRHIEGRRFTRRQIYVDLVGELIVRGTFHHRAFRTNSADPLFRGVVLEYLRMLRGEDRSRLMRAARDMGMVDRFVKELTSRDRNLRVSAAQALGEIGDPTTVEELVFALADPVDEVGAQAAAALARIGDPRAVKSMLAAMDHQEQWNAQRLADSLFSFGKDAVPEMTRYLQSSGRYRPLIARTLGLIGDLRAEPALIQALSSASLELRLRSVAALGRAGSIDAVPHLVEALDDEDWRVRAQAASALGRRRDREGLPALRRALADPSWWVRHNSAAALAQVAGGNEALRRALDHPDPYARDAAASMLLSTDAAIAAVRSVGSEDPLERAASEEFIGALAEAGKEEYFVAAGLDPHDVKSMRLRHELKEYPHVASDR